MSSSPKRPSPPSPDPNWEMELHGKPAKRKATGDSRDEMLAHAVLRIEQDSLDLGDEFGDTDRVTLPPPTGMDDHVAKMMAEAALLEDVDNEGDRPTPLFEIEAAIFGRPLRQSEPTPRAPIPATSPTRAIAPGSVRTQPDAMRTQPAPQPSRIVPRSITPVPFAAARPVAPSQQASGVTRSPVRGPTPAPFPAPQPAQRTPAPFPAPQPAQRTPAPVASTRSPVRAPTPAPFAAAQAVPRTPPPAAPVVARPVVRAPTPAPFPATRVPQNAPAAPHTTARATAAAKPEGARDRIPSSLDFDDLPAVFAFGDLDEPASVPPRSAPISDPAISPSLMSPPISEPAISPPFGAVDSTRFGAANGAIAARSSPSTSVPPRSSPQTAGDPVSLVIAGIEARFSAKDYGRALVMAEAALEEHPNNPSVVAYTKRCREELCTRYLERLGADDHVPRLAMHRGALTGLSLDHRAGFLLSCVDGMSSVEEIVDVSAMPKLDAVRLLYELVQEGVLEMVPRR